MVISKFQKRMNIIKKNKATEESESLGDVFGLGLDQSGEDRVIHFSLTNIWQPTLNSLKNGQQTKLVSSCFLELIVW